MSFATHLWILGAGTSWRGCLSTQNNIPSLLIAFLDKFWGHPGMISIDDVPYGIFVTQIDLTPFRHIHSRKLEGVWDDVSGGHYCEVMEMMSFPPNMKS